MDFTFHTKHLVKNTWKENPCMMTLMKTISFENGDFFSLLFVIYTMYTYMFTHNLQHHHRHHPLDSFFVRAVLVCMVGCRKFV